MHGSKGGKDATKRKWRRNTRSQARLLQSNMQKVAFRVRRRDLVTANSPVTRTKSSTSPLPSPSSIASTNYASKRLERARLFDASSISYLP